MIRGMVIIGALLALFGGPLSASANTLTVTPGPDGTVMLAADDGVDGAVKIDLTFSYSTAFSGARITIQGGDYSEEQMVPGAMKLVISRDLPEAAFVMIVNFDVKPADQPCTVNFVAATYTYDNGRTASPRVIILPAIVQQKSDPAPDAAQATAATDARSAKPAAPESGEDRAISTNRVSPSGQDKPDEKEKPGAGENLNSLEYQAYPDPLQRFREYRGDRKLAGLLHLFDFVNPCGCRQTPPVAISDGLGTVSLSCETDPASQKAPNFGVTGARFISLRRDSEKSWTIELIPNRGEHEVVLYVVNGRVLKRIPLTVAAPLALFLDRLTPGEALSPLLEFTIAANYLAGHKETAANAGH